MRLAHSVTLSTVYRVKT